MMQHDVDEELSPIGRPDRRAPASRVPAGRLDLVTTWVLFCLSVLVLAAGWFGVVLAMLTFDACSDGGCDEAAGSITYVGFPIASVLSTLFYAVTAGRRRRARRRAWTLGAGAVLTVVALFVVAVTVIQIASRSL